MKLWRVLRIISLFTLDHGGKPFRVSDSDSSLEGFTGRTAGFTGRTAGIGPVIDYLMPLGDETLLSEFRWLPELTTKNRLEGNYFWLKVIYQF